MRVLNVTMTKIDTISKMYVHGPAHCTHTINLAYAHHEPLHLLLAVNLRRL